MEQCRNEAPMTDTLFLITGPSGSGKTTLCDQLCTISWLKSVESYTTRKPRYEGERGHIFVESYVDWLKTHPAPVAAYTKFDNNEYWTTIQQLEEADLYVIDPAGVCYMRSLYTGSKALRIVYLDTSALERFRRMRSRGDSVWASLRRLLHDVRQFWGWKKQADFVVKNHDLAQAFTELNQLIKRREAIERN